MVIFSKLSGTAIQVNRVIHAINEAGADEPILLCGYSRGGAAAIAIASKLKTTRRRVDGLFLFDPVDSDLTLSETETIPNNVAIACVATRDPKHGELFAKLAGENVKSAISSATKMATDLLKTDVLPFIPSVLPIDPVKFVTTVRSAGAFGKKTVDALSSQAASLHWKHMRARSLMFQNCGAKAEPGVKLELGGPFLGTHAALGGLMWPDDAYPDRATRQTDHTCVGEVRTWMWSQLLKYGFAKSLTS